MSSDGPKSSGPTPAELYIDMLIDFPKLAVCALQGESHHLSRLRAFTSWFAGVESGR